MAHSSLRPYPREANATPPCVPPTPTPAAHRRPLDTHCWRFPSSVTRHCAVDGLGVPAAVSVSPCCHSYALLYDDLPYLCGVHRADNASRVSKLLRGAAQI